MAYDIITAVSLTTFIVGIVYGVSLYKYKFFPFRPIRDAYHILRYGRYRSWSIAIYRGPSPLSIAPPTATTNPILTGRDVTDVKALFVADPFLVFRNGMFYIFFEVYNGQSGKGEIGYAESDNCEKWTYKQLVISENFHLSYPHVFEYDGVYYLIPESQKDFSVRLYRAECFPNKWEFVGKILDGVDYADPTVLHYANTWWMFVSVGNAFLHLYVSDSLFEGWALHPKSPIVRSDKHISRPAGRIVEYDGKLYRFTQDCDPSYGIQVFAFEVTTLTRTQYSEILVSPKPLIGKTGRGWNAAGMHHIDVAKVGNEWIAVVDGRHAK